MSFPIITLHNVFSSKSCTEFVKIASGMGFKSLVITNAQGSAAQNGVPSAQKAALKAGLNFMVLNDIADLPELFSPDVTFVVTPPPYGEKNIDNDFVQGLEGKKWIAVFGGSDPGLSRKDLSKADEIVQVPAGDIGSLGILTLGLALLTGKFGFNR